MNRNELIEAIVAEHGISKAQASGILTTITSTIIEAVKNDDQVQLVGFGTFKRSSREARVGRNPKTGEEIQIAAQYAPRFVAGKAFKDALNGN